MIRIVICSLLASLTMIGCAKKRPLAQTERGVLDGTVEVTLELKQKLRDRFKLADDGYCFQAVKLTASDRTSIELSKGACPATGIAASAIATFDFWGDATQNLPDGTPGTILLAGASQTTASEKSPVGHVRATEKKNAEGAATYAYSIDEFCTGFGRYDAAKSCEVIPDAQNNAVEFKFDRSETLTRHLVRLGEINRANNETLLLDLDAAEQRLAKLAKDSAASRSDLGKLEDRLVDTQAEIDDLSQDDATLNTYEDRINELADRKTKLTADEFNSVLTRLERRFEALEQSRKDVFARSRHDALKKLSEDLVRVEGKLNYVLDRKNGQRLTQLSDSVDSLKKKTDFLMLDSTKTAVEEIRSSAWWANTNITAATDPEKIKKLGETQSKLLDLRDTLTRIDLPRASADIKKLQAEVDDAMKSLKKYVTDAYQKAVETLSVELISTLKKIDEHRIAETRSAIAAGLHERETALNNRLAMVVSGPLAADTNHLERTLEEMRNRADDTNAAQLDNFLTSLAQSSAIKAPNIAVDGPVQEEIDALRSRTEKAKAAIRASRDAYLDRIFAGIETSARLVQHDRKSRSARLVRSGLWKQVKVLLDHRAELSNEEIQRAEKVSTTLWNDLQIDGIAD